MGGMGGSVHRWKNQGGGLVHQVLLQLQLHFLESQGDGSENPPMPPISELPSTYIFVHFKPTFSTWEGYGRVVGYSRRTMNTQTHNVSHYIISFKNTKCNASKKFWVNSWDLVAVLRVYCNSSSKGVCCRIKSMLTAIKQKYALGA